MTLNLASETLIKGSDLYLWDDGMIKPTKVFGKNETNSHIQLRNYVGSKLVQVSHPRFIG